MLEDKEKGAVDPIEEAQETAEEALDEMVEEIVEGKEVEEAQAETDAEGETSDSEGEDPKKADEEVEDEEGEEFSLEDLTPEDLELPDEHDNTQKRIDKLTAEKYELKDRLARLEAKETAAKESERSQYTDAQLDKAEERAIEDGDRTLLAEVRKERRKNMVADIKAELYKEETLKKQQAESSAQEAQQVIDTFGYLKDESPHLDVQNRESMLFKLCVVLYSNPRYAERYNRLGGQMLCASDAIKILRKKGLGKKKTKSEKALENKVKKLKKKTSVRGSKSVKTEPKKAKVKNTDDERKSAFAERVAQKDRLMGMS